MYNNFYSYRKKSQRLRRPRPKRASLAVARSAAQDTSAALFGGSETKLRAAAKDLMRRRKGESWRVCDEISNRPLQVLKGACESLAEQRLGSVHTKGTRRIRIINTISV